MIDNVDSSRSLNGDVVKFQQVYKGYPVYNSVGTTLIKDNEIIYYTDNFVKDYVVAAPNNVVISKNTALQKIADHFGKQEIQGYPVLGFFDAEPESTHTAKQRLTYVGR